MAVRSQSRLANSLGRQKSHRTIRKSRHSQIEEVRLFLLHRTGTPFSRIGISRRTVSRYLSGSLCTP